MPRVHVDISILGNDPAYGRISGSVDVPIIPQIGNQVSFGEAQQLLRVTSRIIVANSDDEVLLSLEDIVAETASKAKTAMTLFERRHGLFAEHYSEGE